jgi:hypothetical protein
MFYGEHLGAEEVAVKCSCGCGIAATVEVVDKLGQSCGWFTRSCAYKKRKELRRIEKIAKAIVRRGW